MKVKELKPMQGISEIQLEIVSKAEPRPFATERGSGTVCSCAAKDDTGEVQVTLWNEQCNQFEEGDKITITEGWCSLFKGQLQVSTGKKGKIEKNK
ncbi:MAG: OB-fold nucleic acid binding domain-containing protein [Candidatus ainarchaeum sp.]|nr:OB-fold nucleic acid binding domain-containing protein [Candidatus ainarchaeum sp.]